MYTFLSTPILFDPNTYTAIGEFFDNLFVILSNIADLLYKTFSEIYSYVKLLPALIPKITNVFGSLFPASVIAIFATILVFAIIKLVIGRES